MELKSAGETEVPGGNLHQCYYNHHKSHMTTWDRTRAAMAEKIRSWYLGYISLNGRLIDKLEASDRDLPAALF
jgi:hypothetical protein